MRLLACLLVGLSAEASSGVTLGDASVPHGMSVHSTHITDVRVQVDARALGTVHKVELRKRHEQRSQLLVLQAEHGGPQRVRVGWTVNHQTDGGPDGSRSFDLPVAGKRYVVALGPHERTVETADVSAVERQIATEAADLLPLLRTLRAMVPARPVVGTAYPAGAMFSGLVRDAPGEPAVSGALTMREVREVDGVPCAVFDVALRLESEGELEPGVRATMSAELVGHVAIETRSGWTRELSVRGPVQLRGRGARLGRPFTMVGQGVFSSDTKLEFRR